jgi:hypothetical protein
MTECAKLRIIANLGPLKRLPMKHFARNTIFLTFFQKIEIRVAQIPFRVGLARSWQPRAC